MRDAALQDFKDQTTRVARGARWGKVKVVLSPLRAGEWPFVLEAPFDLVASLADGQLDRRFVHHAVINTLEPVVEKTDLIFLSLGGVVRVHVRTCLHPKLLMFGCGTHERFGVAAQMQRHTRPIANSQQRNGNLVPLRLRTRKAPKSRLLLSQKCNVLVAHAFGTCCDARPTV